MDVVDALRGHIDMSKVPTYTAMAGFRDLLVHGYAVVDDARVVDILHSRVDDLSGFRAAMAAIAADGDAS